jgi:hypothetical protein
MRINDHKGCMYCGAALVSDEDNRLEVCGDCSEASDTAHEPSYEEELDEAFRIDRRGGFRDLEIDTDGGAED